MIQFEIEIKDDEFEQIISDIREHYILDQAGCKFDFLNNGYIKSSLFITYYEAHKEIERLHGQRMQIFLKGWLKG